MTEKTKKRAPIVTVLGHVDHGKSSILEAIKDLKITEKESGGITQHMGAYMVEQDDEKITFIDTPGHEAFSAMRSRGADVADIGILVIAADEGVKKQTKEAINHIKEAEIPFIVALNKMDKPGASPDKVKKELSLEGIMVEEYGGNVPCIEVSALKKTGMDELLEMIVLVAEMEDLKADPSKNAKGVVIETNIDPGKGVSATLLVKNGTLERGDVIGTDCCYGTVRNMVNFKNDKIEAAGPSTPARTSGLKMNPHVGEEFKVFETKKEAKNARKNEKGEVDFSEICSPEGVDLNLIIKADVLGSLEAIKNVFEKLPREKIGINVISAGIGAVGERDVEVARSCNADIFSYRTEVERNAELLAGRNDIEIVKNEVIYNLLEEVEKRMKELLPSETMEEEQGKVKILEVFKTDKRRQILGGKAVEGAIEKGASVKIVRDKEEIGEGKLINLKKEDKDMDKIPERENFGMLYEGDVKVKEGDFLIVFKIKELKPEL